MSQKKKLPQRLVSLPGSILASRYVVGEYIGSGAYGHVFKGVEVLGGLPDDTIAIKIIEAENNEWRTFQVAREGFYSLHFRHPRVVETLDFQRITIPIGGTDKTVYALVMPRAETSLETFLKHQAILSPENKLEIVGAVAEGIHYLHTIARKRHGDIHPGNILRINGIWKLGDFGLIRDISQGTVKTTQLRFPVAWTDPTTIAKRVVSARADIYSIGLLAHFLEYRNLPEEPLDFASSHLNSENRLVQIAAHCLGAYEYRPDSGTVLGRLTEFGYRRLHEDEPETAPSLQAPKGNSWRVGEKSLSEMEAFRFLAPQVHGQETWQIRHRIREFCERLSVGMPELDVINADKWIRMNSNPPTDAWLGLWCAKGWLRVINKDNRIVLTTVGSKILVPESSSE